MLDSTSSLPVRVAQQTSDVWLRRRYLLLQEDTKRSRRENR
ncbi:MAG: hypothetical protein WAU75_02460 [Solirubrobacteraceae bacterium]